jgi:hypothetical protein
MVDIPAKINTPVFQDASRCFVEDGRFPSRELLPIIPPDARIASTSNVPLENRGKAPGAYNPAEDAWAGLSGWQSEGMSSIKRAASWPTSNVGLRAALFPAIDIDTLTPEARDIVEHVASFYLGPSPVRERGDAPRSLLVYRLTGDEPIRKSKIIFTLNGQRHHVDVLGAGQQYVIAGVHPSGAPYGWRNGYDLTSWTVDGLTTVTAGDMRNFIDGLMARIVTLGGEVIEGHTGSTTPSEAIPVATIEPSTDIARALDALRAIPNTAEVLPDRTDLTRVLSAFKAVLGSSADEAYEQVVEWATKHHWADEEYVGHIWKSITHVRISPDALFGEARKHGWRNACDEFTAMPEEMNERPADAMQEVASQIVYWAEESRWLVPGSGEILNHAALNHHSIGLKIAPAGAGGQKAASAILRNSGAIREIVGVTYVPGEPRLMVWTWEGKRGLWYNRWRAGPEIAGGGSVKQWTDLMEWLYPNEEERLTVIRWMAHQIQRPGVKIRWAPVFLGKQGIGKDLSLRPLIWGLGQHNVREISPHNLMSHWTDWYEAQLVIVQEMVRLDKVEVYERVKAAISGTGASTLMVEQKYQPMRPVPNRVAFCFMTNNPNALAIAPDDRRFFVVEAAPQQRRSPEYYDRLVAWYDDGGDQAVAAYLKAFDISGLDVNAAPAWTDAKQEMLEETLPFTSSWLTDQFGVGGLFEGRTVVSYEDARRSVNRQMSVPARVREQFSPVTFRLGMSAIGWQYRQGKILLGDNNRRRVWVHPDLIEATAERIRQVWKTETTGLDVFGED